MLAIYEGIEETIIIECNKNDKPNRKEVKDYFGPGTQRDIEDFDLKFQSGSAWIYTRLKVQ